MPARPSGAAGTPSAVLLELRVENLLLIERAELRLAPGLNVLTGETGAGKTVLAHALDLLLGGRRAQRASCARARPRPTWRASSSCRRRCAGSSGERLPADAEEVVLARRVSAEGRTRAYLSGRSASVGDLRDVAGELIAFYGQHEHRKLTLASAQLDVLDGFCGAEQLRAGAPRSPQAYARARARGVAGGAARARRRARARARPARVRAGGDRRRRSRASGGGRAARRARAPAPPRGAARGRARRRPRRSPPRPAAPGRRPCWPRAERALDGVAGVDPELDALAERLRAVRLEAEDLAAELRRYEQGVEAPPGRLEEVEERLAVLERLKRKHGGTIAAVLAHAERCRARRDELAGAEVALEGTTAELAEADAELQSLGEDLRKARTKAAPKLARAVRERLAELAMEGARFEVALEPRPSRGPAGDEAVEFLIAPNPGVPAGPLREIASGGELSRVMLALMGVAAEAGGGRPPSARCWSSTRSTPASAATPRARSASGCGRSRRAARCCASPTCRRSPRWPSATSRSHKDSASKPARATVTEIESDAVVGELVRMLGADERGDAARRHARHCGGRLLGPRQGPIRGRAGRGRRLRGVAVSRTKPRLAGGPAGPREVRGIARLGKRTKHLVKRLRRATSRSSTTATSTASRPRT